MTVDISMDGENSSISMLNDMDPFSTQVNGSIWTMEYQYSKSEGYESGSYGFSQDEGEAVGIVRQVIHSSGKVDMKARYEFDMGDGTTTDIDDYSMERDIDTHWDLNLDLTYMSPLPWLPTDEGNLNDIPGDSTITADYEGNLTGHIDMNTSSSRDYSSMPGEIDRDVSKELDSSTEVWAHTEVKDNNTISRPSPVTNSAYLGMESMMAQRYETDDQMDSDPLDMTLLSLVSSTKARYDHSDDFYTSMKIGSGSQLSMPLSQIENSSFKGMSEKTGAEEVDEFLQDEEKYFEENVLSDSSSWFRRYAIPFFTVVLPPALITTIVLLLDRKKDTRKR